MKKDKTKPFSFHFDLGTFLLVTGALANVTMWIGAFSSTEAKGPVGDWINAYLLPILGSVSGLAMGITAVAGLVFVLVRFAGMQPTYERKVRGKDEYKTHVNYRYWMTLAVLIVLVIVSWALLAPFAYAQLSGSQSLFTVMGDTWSKAWAVGRIVAADLVLGGIALVMGAHPGANRSAGEQPSSNSLSEGSGTSATRSATKSGRSAKAAKPAAIVPCRYAGAGCERTGSQPAMNAHARSCRFKPTIVMPVEEKKKVEQ